LLKAILVFNGDFNLRNKRGETPWDIILLNFQSKNFNNLDKEWQIMLYTLAAVGASGPAQLATSSSNSLGAAAQKSSTGAPR